MLTIASGNHSSQARRHLERLLPINPSFAETACWKRCVPRDFPIPSPWRHPQTILETMSGEKEIGVVKARLTKERCERSPGTVGEVVGSGVKVACGDEWIVVNKLKVEERYVNSAEVLKPGSRLSDGR
jgi:hypothetical protein